MPCLCHKGGYTDLNKKNIYKGRIVDLNIEQVRLPNGKNIELEVIHHSGASAIVPLKDNGQVVLIKQFRHAAGGFIYEIPAGRLDKGEDPAACAARELEEEVGYKTRRLEKLITILTTPGFCDERVHIFMARNLIQTKQRLDPDEVLEIVEMSLDEAIRGIRDGIINDAKTIAGLSAVYFRIRGQS